MSLPFTYAVVDDDGEVIRQYRWSVKEAKWYTNNNPCARVIKLIVEKPKPFDTNDYEECLF